MARKTKADMIEAYRAKIAELEAKEQEKAKAEAKTAVETIALCDEAEAKARAAYDKAVLAAQETLDNKLARISQRRERAQLAIEEVAMNEKFSQLALDEVGVDDDTDVNA
jgi:hypothetical protein